jgi:hypothetical protein
MAEYRKLNNEVEQEVYGRRKRVKNVETGVVFPSISAAERAVGAKRGTMYHSVNKPTRTTKGYHWITV